jgi:hypothetical protein
MIEDNDEKIYLCMVENRWSGCLLKKNFCCGYCDQLEECLKIFKLNPGNKLKPCSLELAIDCEFKESIL